MRIVLMREIKAFEDIEHLDKLDAAGRRRRHRDDVVAAIGAAHRFALVGAHSFQDRRRSSRRRRPECRRQVFPQTGLRRTRAVHPSRSLPGNLRDRPAPDASPATSVVPSALRKIFAVDGQRASRASSFGGRSARSSLTGKPSRASANAGAIRSASVKRPEPYFASAIARPATVPGTPMASAVSRDFARIGIAIAHRGNDLLLIACRRGLAIIDRGVFAGGEMDQHEAAAADIAGARIGHRHGEADRDRGINRIAAFLQDIDADARRQRFLRHHHAVRSGTPIAAWPI